MKFEICKKKTKCVGCKKDMSSGDIRGVTGGSYYDPLRYTCLKCSMKEGIPIDSIIKIYREKIKMYEVKIKLLEDLRRELLA